MEESTLLESFIVTRGKTAPSYRTNSDILKGKTATPRHKIEMYAPETGPPVLKGSVFRRDPLTSSIVSPPQGYSSSLSHQPRIDNDMLKSSSFKHNLAQSYERAVKFRQQDKRPSDKLAWSNGAVSYKVPSFSRSVRLDMSTMSLDEQLNHTQTLTKYSNKDLPIYEVQRLQKQEELV